METVFSMIRTSPLICWIYLTLCLPVYIEGQEHSVENYSFIAKSDDELVEAIKSLQVSYNKDLHSIRSQYKEIYSKTVNQLIAKAPTLDDETKLIAEFEEKKTKHPLLIDIYADENFQLILRAISVEGIRQAAKDYASKNKFRKAFAMANNTKEFREAYMKANNTEFWTHHKDHELDL